MHRFLLAVSVAAALSAQTHIRHPDPAPAGRPILFEGNLPGETHQDSIRVVEETSGQRLPAKVEWRRPVARVSWLSTGAGSYRIEFDRKALERALEPAMIGTGDRMTYGRKDVRGRLSGGLNSYPVPVDIDSDGDLDIIVGSTDRPYNGIFLFNNLGSNAAPLFDRAEWLGPGKPNLVAAEFNGDGKTDLVVSGGYYSDVRANRLSKFVPVDLARSYHVGRDDLWYPVDWDRDGKIDVLVGVSDWREYGWDDAFNTRGEWTRGDVHGFVYFHRNRGTNGKPSYAAPVKIEAAGRPIDLRGSPAPNPVDWIGDGRLSVIGGDFVDSITLFRDRGRGLEAGVKLTAGGSPIRVDLCMNQPRVVSWHADGRPSLLVGEEGGWVSLIENTAPRGSEPIFAAPQYLEQIDPFLKSVSLPRPVAVDWNGDAKLDLIVGNSSGYLHFFENTGVKTAPAFTDRGNLTAGGKTIRVIAGPNGSVQGPIEEKWGYSNPSVADWDVDGRLDILVNDIWGKVVWYRNAGGSLETARDIEVEWESEPLKPDWVWWKPAAKQLVTQWRTTPKVADWNRDGLPDLVMLDYRGYLALYRRVRAGDNSSYRLRNGSSLKQTGDFCFSAGDAPAPASRRKVDIVDWDNDGDLDLITDTPDGAGWYENIGNQDRPVMQWRGELLARKLSGHNPTPNAADWNGDGRLDLIVGAEDGHLYYFERSFLDRK